VATQRIHAWIEAHPGCTRQDVVEAALSGQWVDPGYANRRYAQRINHDRAKKAAEKVPVARGIATGTKPPATPANVDRVKAQSFVVKDQISQMKTQGSIARDDDGRLRVRRPLSATQGLTREQIVTDPDVTRADIAERELLRALRPLRDKLGVLHHRVPRDVQVLMQRWLDLKLVHRPNS
jgi:hypothetical protein